ncbi:hypothetical protein N7468_004720 [Penicillium chermesinum]|uniref:F-box domain-containing protein n=1 Tax=Penicillium chermesinum TaxID=63820 RepID=A0A9W9P9Q5_9EURO|nr:uncharacterized protein N7468_004720 [Penicillium chermesinum]KAJ5240101.1 hypothetical protein N7468_004720 [Penicillium chermesinum]
MTSFKNLSVQTLRDILRKVRTGAKHKNGSQREIPGSRSTLRLDNPNPLPPWGLPVEIQILIFAHCGTYDFLALKLVCKAFYDILSTHEHEIVRRYLRRHRHGTLPSPIDSERTYTRNPEDDVVLLSDLFPPAKSARGGHLYTFRYLSSLRHKQDLCSRLCYYLADRVMDRFISTEPVLHRSSFPSRASHTALVQRGKAGIWFHLSPLM